LLHAVIPDEYDALAGEVLDGGRDIGDAPAQDGVSGVGAGTAVTRSMVPFASNTQAKSVCSVTGKPSLCS
jgi:hypothetical protein